MDELDHEKIFNKIIFKELEPSVLNEAIIRKIIYEQGPTGEAGRLFKLEELRYEKITVLRLEFQNILKIDHLWILPNLQVLSLAFNKIDKIENLEELKNLKELNLTFNMIEKLENLDELKSLEIFSVFGNQIKKIENVDGMENLIIFSAGNNQIETTDGLERLRFLKRLRALNLKGNEIEKRDKHFRIFIAGLLPSLHYYENVYITKAEREEGRDRFRFKLRDITDNEKVELAERELESKEREDEVHLTKCFVENLNQLFNSLFQFDSVDEGGCLLEIGEDADLLVEEFREQANVHIQKIQEIGLEEFERREKELEIFNECCRKGREVVQKHGQEKVNRFLEQKEDFFKRATEVMEAFRKELDSKKKDADVDAFTQETDQKLSVISEEFNKLFDETWSLMEEEMHLHESLVDANSNFGHIMQDMMNEFLEKCQVEFVHLRNIENNFVDELIETVQKFVTEKAQVEKESDIPEALRESIIDKDIILNFAAGMRDFHTQKIDSREDRLLTRAREWVKNLSENMQTDEINRNRRKVMEINYFLDIQRENFDKITSMEFQNLVDI